MRFRAVIFDFDGVVLDSANIKTEAFPEVFKEYPELSAPITAYHLENQGISRFKKFEWIYENLLKMPLTEEGKAQLGERFSTLVFEKVLQAPFITGAIEFLEFLLENEVPAFIASGTPENELIDIVRRRNLEKYFLEVCGSPRTKTTIVNEIASKYSIGPKDMLFLGDATKDFHAATETGATFVAVESDSMRPFWLEKGIKPISDLTILTERFFVPASLG